MRDTPALEARLEAVTGELEACAASGTSSTGRSLGLSIENELLRKGRMPAADLAAATDAVTAAVLAYS